jgi:hypothetical protein
MHTWSLYFTTWYSILFASYIGYIHVFWWLLGIIHKFPNFIGLTWENQKTSISMILTFRDSNEVQMTWNFVGANFLTDQDLGAKEVQQSRHKGQTGMAHMARFLGCVGPTRSPLVALMTSIFVSMDSPRPKTDYIKGPPMGRKRERRRNTKPQNRSLGDKDRRGKTLAGHCRRGLHPLQRLYLRHHDKEGVVHLWTMGLWQ